jgi:diguanylate cyclase (GGDEF)-like protein/PAS domain S-box-containing protein
MSKTVPLASVLGEAVVNVEPTMVLIVASDPADAGLISESLAATGVRTFCVEWVARLSTAIARLEKDRFEVVLLDLTLSDSKGCETFDQVLQAAPNTLILVLSTASDEDTARQAVQRGAEDFWIKGHADAHWLPRALHYLIERKITREALYEEKERAQVTLNSIGDAVLTTNLMGNVTYMNVVAETMTGWSLDSALGRPLAEVFKIIDSKTRQAVADPAQRAIAGNKTVALAADSVLIHRDGSESAIEDSSAPIHSRDNKILGAVIVFHDVSASRAMTQKMSHLAQHDFLTGLPNRLLLTERLSRAIGLANRHHKQVALLFLDLDYFKSVNDSLGHAIGDELLQSVAARLVACVRSTDTVCRQGGDEFVILLAEIERPQDAAHIADKLLAALAVPQLISGHELHVTLSIGISIYPDDAVDVDTTMRNADTAMYFAKASGRNNYQFFKEHMNIHPQSRRMALSVVA